MKIEIKYYIWSPNKRIHNKDKYQQASVLALLYL